MTTYSIEGRMVEDGDPGLQKILAEVYARRVRPRCMCVADGVEMYTARSGDQVIIKRLPDSGSQHSPTCESFEPDSELSGLGQVMGSAIRQDMETGVTDLRVGFSLTRRAGRAVVASAGASATSSVKTDGARLSLRGMLHYLWEEAEFHRWSPLMAGKRKWPVIRKYLLQALADKRTKGNPLADQVFIPEPFFVEEKHALAQRREALFSKISHEAKKGEPRQLLILIGEVNQLEPSRFGKRLVVKQLPDCPFGLNDDIAKRLMSRYRTELNMWNAIPDARLVVIATFGVEPGGVPMIEEAALMMTSKDWLPCETAHEHQLLEVLMAQTRRFTKGLRYNLAQDVPMPSAVLVDTVPPTALYVLDGRATDSYREALDELAESHADDYGVWEWVVESGTMPPLPAPNRDQAFARSSSAPTEAADAATAP
jgi:hypothetical protein